MRQARADRRPRSSAQGPSTDAEPRRLLVQFTHKGVSVGELSAPSPPPATSSRTPPRRSEREDDDDDDDDDDTTTTKTRTTARLGARGCAPPPRRPAARTYNSRPPQTSAVVYVGNSNRLGSKTRPRRLGRRSTGVPCRWAAARPPGPHAARRAAGASARRWGPPDRATISPQYLRRCTSRGRALAGVIGGTLRGSVFARTRLSGRSE